MNFVLEMLNAVYSGFAEELYFVFGFVVLPTLLLAIAFGVSWPIVQYGKKNWDSWKEESNSLKKLFYMGLAAAVIGVGVLFIVLDWLVALGPCSAVFHEMPNNDFRFKGVRLPWLVLLTTRIQGYIFDWAHETREFRWYQKVYIIFVYRVANFIDRSPHFDKPRGFTMKVF